MELIYIDGKAINKNIAKNSQELFFCLQELLKEARINSFAATGNIDETRKEKMASDLIDLISELNK